MDAFTNCLNLSWIAESCDEFLMPPAGGHPLLTYHGNLRAHVFPRFHGSSVLRQTNPTARSHRSSVNSCLLEPPYMIAACYRMVFVDDYISTRKKASINIVSKDDQACASVRWWFVPVGLFTSYSGSCALSCLCSYRKSRNIEIL